MRPSRLCRSVVGTRVRNVPRSRLCHFIGAPLLVANGGFVALTRRVEEPSTLFLRCSLAAVPRSRLITRSTPGACGRLVLLTTVGSEQVLLHWTVPQRDVKSPIDGTALGFRPGNTNNKARHEPRTFFGFRSSRLRLDSVVKTRAAFMQTPFDLLSRRPSRVCFRIIRGF